MVNRTCFCETHQVEFVTDGDWPSPRWDGSGIYVRLRCPRGHFTSALLGPIVETIMVQIPAVPQYVEVDQNLFINDQDD